MCPCVTTLDELEEELLNIYTYSPCYAPLGRRCTKLPRTLPSWFGARAAAGDSCITMGVQLKIIGIRYVELTLYETLRYIPRRRSGRKEEDYMAWLEYYCCTHTHYTVYTNGSSQGKWGGRGGHTVGKIPAWMLSHSTGWRGVLNSM